MATIRYADQAFSVAPGESVLDALLKQDQPIPNSCRAGVCQSCLLRATEGEIPKEAQTGLKDTLRAQGYFLACRCQPADDMVVELPKESDVRLDAQVIGLELLAEKIIRLRLHPAVPFDYRAGQHVTLWRNETLGRSYSLASVPALDEALEFHIRVIPDGQFSAWAHNELRIGDRLALQGPNGQCFYVQDSEERNMLLIGTGTGLAPLYGIVRDALHRGHRGGIHLFHGALNASGLYLGKDLRALVKEHENFHYHPSILRADDEDSLPPGIEVGPVDQLALAHTPALAGWKIYLCGAPDLVNTLRKRVFLGGASMSDIYADAFLPAAQSKQAAA